MKNTFIRYFFIFITIIIILSLYLLFEKNYDGIIKILDADIESILKNNLFLVFLSFFGISSLFNIFFFPGKTLFVLISSFIINNFLYTFILTYSCDVIWGFIAYPLLCYFKNFSKIFLKIIDQQVYKILKKKIKTDPWKVCFIAQSLSIPQTVKNMILISFDIKFLYFFISKMVVSFFYLTLIIITGMSLKSLKDLDDKDRSSNEQVYIISGSILVISIFLFIFIVCFIRNEYNKLINQEEDCIKEENDEIKLKYKKDKKISFLELDKTDISDNEIDEKGLNKDNLEIKLDNLSKTCK